MASGITTIVSLVSIGMVLRNVIIRGERIGKIEEKSDHIVSMICGDEFIPDVSID